MQDRRNKGAKESLGTELNRMREREAATREILEVISQSRADEAPVFEAILSNAQRLSVAPFSFLAMTTEDGLHIEIMAEGNDPFEPFRPGCPMRLSRIIRP